MKIKKEEGMITVKRFIFVLLITAILVTLTACGPTGQTEAPSSTPQTQPTDETIALRITSLTSFGMGMERNQEIFDLYTVTHPNVKIVYEPIADDTGSDWNGYVAKLQTMIAAGTAPDIFDMATEGLQSIFTNNLARPLDDFLNDRPDIKAEILADINPVLYEPFTYQGKTYCFPIMWNNCITHVNLKLFEEANVELPDEDWNKEDFLAICEKLTKEVGGQKQYGALVPAYYFANNAWLYAFDASFLNEDMTAAAVNSENAVECFQFMHDLIHKYKYAPVPQPNDDYVQMLIDGKVAMICAGRWPCAQYATNDFTDVAVQYNPTFKKKANVYGTEGLLISKDTKHYNEAAEFCVWSASPEFISQFVQSGSCPSRTSIGREVVEGLGYPQNAKVYFDSLDVGMKSVEAPIAYADIATIYDTYLSMMMTDPNSDIKAMCDKMADEINAAIQKNK